MNIPTILIVDDEVGQRNVIKGYLEGRLNCRIKEAANGDEAISIMKDCKCDLLILDIKMPAKGGIEVLDELKEEETPPGIIVITAWDSEQVYKECKERGVTEYINKPLALDHLLRSVSRFLEKRGQLSPKKSK